MLAFGMQSSASVFAAECNLQDDFDPELRPLIRAEIQLPPPADDLADEPLLLSLLRNYEVLAK